MKFSTFLPAYLKLINLLTCSHFNLLLFSLLFVVTRVVNVHFTVKLCFFSLLINFLMIQCKIFSLLTEQNQFNQLFSFYVLLFFIVKKFSDKKKFDILRLLFVHIVKRIRRLKKKFHIIWDKREFQLWSNLSHFTNFTWISCKNIVPLLSINLRCQQRCFIFCLFRTFNDNKISFSIH